MLNVHYFSVISNSRASNLPLKTNPSDDVVGAGDAPVQSNPLESLMNNPELAKM